MTAPSPYTDAHHYTPPQPQTHPQQHTHAFHVCNFRERLHFVQFLQPIST